VKDGKEEKAFDALEWLAAMGSLVPDKGEPEGLQVEAVIKDDEAGTSLYEISIVAIYSLFVSD
jgi:hypothetical protein